MQNYILHAYLRNDRYRQNEWEDLQKNDQKLVTAYRIDGDIIGMNAYQMICYSAYQIFWADYNQSVREALDEQHPESPNYSENHVIRELK